MKKFFLFILFLFTPQSAFAICPVCTIAVGAGVGFSRWLGIDDAITGIWVGGLTMSLVIWTIDWFNKKNIRFHCRKIIILASYYALIVLPLYYIDILGHPLNTVWGMDKLLLGIIVGSISFLAFSAWYLKMKKNHGDHAYFPFQKVVMPIAPLIIFSIIFYFLTK